MRLPRNQIIPGDARTVMMTLPSGSVDAIVTSPPYFRLRDYQVDGQLGLEPTVEAWVEQIVAMTDEARRLLTPTGTLWLNLGDSYSLHRREGAERKSLLLAPERVAQRLVDAGWILRNKLVWAKTNTVPSSVRDRLATKYEVIYLFSHQPSYYFDLDSLRVPHNSRNRPRTASSGAARTPAKRPDWLGPNGDSDGGLQALRRAGLSGHPLGKNPGDVWRLATSQQRSGHVAAFPEELARRLVLSSCPEARCVQCRAPYVRPVERRGEHRQRARRLDLQPTCTCHAGSEPGLVLDPFIGSGTTAIAAERLGRDWLGIELAATSIAIAEGRLGRKRSAA